MFHGKTAHNSETSIYRTISQNLLHSKIRHNIEKPLQVVALKLAVGSDVLGFHKALNARIAFPTTKRDFITAQVNVAIGKNTFPFLRQSFKGIKVFLLGRIDWPMLAIRFPIFRIARSEQILQGLTPR